MQNRPSSSAEYLPAGRQGTSDSGKTNVMYVYSIYSCQFNRIYVGMSSNVEKRVKEHNDGRTRSTKGYLPWILFYTEALPDRQSAREREKYLKSGCGKEFLKSELKKQGYI